MRLPRSAALVLLLAGTAFADSPASPAPKPLGHTFEDAAQWSRVFDDPARDAWQKPAEVVRLLALKGGETVVDLGAGTGYFVPYLSRAVGAKGHVVGLDIEPDMVRFLTERARRESLANVEARVVKTDDPGLGPATADRILIVDTWHHIPARETYSRKLRDALRPGGSVVVVDFTLDSPRGPHHHHRLAPEAVAAELRAAGLETEVLAEDLPDQYVVVGRRAADR
jgi:predicted methyltransferase